MLEGVTAGYGARPVVRDVSLGAGPGEVVGLIGPNGSGKTTLVRVASRGLRPWAGTVRVARASTRTRSRPPGGPAGGRGAAGRRAGLRLHGPGGGADGPVALPVVRGAGRPDDWAQRPRGHGRDRTSSIWRTGRSTSSRAESGSGWSWRRLWPRTRRSCCWTNPPPTWTCATCSRCWRSSRRLARARGNGRARRVPRPQPGVGVLRPDLRSRGGRVVAAGSPAEVITSRLLRDVFGVEADVVSPARPPGVPVIAPAPPVAARRLGTGSRAAGPRDRRRRAGARSCGVGGAGFEVTAGVLHASDTDAEVAERLNLLRISVPAFSVIDRCGDPRKCRDLMRGPRSSWSATRRSDRGTSRTCGSPWRPPPRRPGYLVRAGRRSGSGTSPGRGDRAVAGARGASSSSRS